MFLKHFSTISKRQGIRYNTIFGTKLYYTTTPTTGSFTPAPTPSSTNTQSSSPSANTPTNPSSSSTNSPSPTDPLSTKKSKWYHQPDLPYLDNAQYLETLNSHVTMQPQKRILLVWGPKSTSKSGGLQLKTEQWRREGRVVIDIDLKGVPSSYPFFLSKFRRAVADSKLQVSRRERKIIAEDLRNRQAKQKGELKDKSEAKKNLFTEVANAIGALVLPIYNLGQIMSSLLKWSKGIDSPEKVDDLIALFELLEVHAKKTNKPTIVIWREIQNLTELRDAPTSEWPMELYQRLFIHFEPRKQRTSRVPVIFESSDLLWTRMAMTLSENSIDPYLLEPFDKEVLKKLLVETTLPGYQEPIFDSNEFEKVWEFSGGHQGTIYHLHSLLINGNSLDGMIEELKKQTFVRIKRAITWVSDKERASKQQLIQEREAFLTELQKSEFQLDTKEIDDKPAIIHLVKYNVLFYDGKRIKPQNKVVESAITEYLELFCKVINESVRG